jgi:hypothetical protein
MPEAPRKLSRPRRARRSFAPAPPQIPHPEPFLQSLEAAHPSGQPPRGPDELDLGRLSFCGPWGGQLVAVLIAVMLVAVALPLILTTQGSTELTTTAVSYGVQGTFRYGP